jgi:hypothetical protein
MNKILKFRYSSEWFKQLWINVKNSELFDVKLFEIFKNKFSDML